LKKSDSLLPLLISFVVEYAIRSVQVNQDVLKIVLISFWIMLMMLVYWAEVLRTLKKNTGSLVAASKECGLDVYTDRSKYMVMS
jgi:hypothetical protein